MEKNINSIWLELSGYLLEFVSKKVNNPDVAEDIVQEVFLKVQIKLLTLKNDENLTS